MTYGNRYCAFRHAGVRGPPVGPVTRAKQALVERHRLVGFLVLAQTILQSVRGSPNGVSLMNQQVHTNETESLTHVRTWRK